MCRALAGLLAVVLQANACGLYTWCLRMWVCEGCMLCSALLCMLRLAAASLHDEVDALWLAH